MTAARGGDAVGALFPHNRVKRRIAPWRGVAARAIIDDAARAKRGENGKVGR